MTDTQDLIVQLKALGVPDWATARYLMAKAADALEDAQAEIERLTAENHELGDKAYQATHRADALQVTNDTLKHMKAAALARLAEVEAQNLMARQIILEHGSGVVGASPVQPSQAPCKGTNCGSTDGVNHSAECHAEHDAAANCGTLDTPGNRHPEHRYAGYKGQAISAGATDDQVAAYQSGVAARVQPSQAGELSDAEIYKGWKQTFSTENPFCPCNLKSFTKSVNWAIAAINAKESAS